MISIIKAQKQLILNLQELKNLQFEKIKFSFK